MWKIKIVHTDNFAHKFFSVKEEKNHAHFIDDKGDFVQQGLLKMDISSSEVVPMENAYRLLGEDKTTHAMRDELLKYFVRETVSQIGNELDVSFCSYKQSSSCHHDPSLEYGVVTLFGRYNSLKEKCEIEIYQRQINFLEQYNKKVVCLVLEEFGVLFLNGKKFLSYLAAAKKHYAHKDYMTFSVDYEVGIHARGMDAFMDYTPYLESIRGFFRPQSKLRLIKGGAKGVLTRPVESAKNLWERVKNSKSGFQILKKMKDSKKKKRFDFVSFKKNKKRKFKDAA